MALAFGVAHGLDARCCQREPQPSPQPASRKRPGLPISLPPSHGLHHQAATRSAAAAWWRHPGTLPSVSAYFPVSEPWLHQRFLEERRLVHRRSPTVHETSCSLPPWVVEELATYRTSRYRGNTVVLGKANYLAEAGMVQDANLVWERAASPQVTSLSDIGSDRHHDAKHHGNRRGQCKKRSQAVLIPAQFAFRHGGFGFCYAHVMLLVAANRVLVDIKFFAACRIILPREYLGQSKGRIRISSLHHQWGMFRRDKARLYSTRPGGWEADFESTLVVMTMKWPAAGLWGPC